MRVSSSIARRMTGEGDRARRRRSGKTEEDGDGDWAAQRKQEQGAPTWKLGDKRAALTTKCTMARSEASDTPPGDAAIQSLALHFRHRRTRCYSAYKTRASPNSSLHVPLSPKRVKHTARASAVRGLMPPCDRGLLQGAGLLAWVCVRLSPGWPRALCRHGLSQFTKR